MVGRYRCPCRRCGTLRFVLEATDVFKKKEEKREQKTKGAVAAPFVLDSGALNPDIPKSRHRSFLLFFPLSLVCATINDEWSRPLDIYIRPAYINVRHTSYFHSTMDRRNEVRRRATWLYPKWIETSFRQRGRAIMLNSCPSFHRWKEKYIISFRLLVPFSFIRW